MAIAKEQIRQIIADKNFTNVTDIYACRKEGFRNILQELMEAEMDTKISQRGIRERKNCRLCTFERSFM